MSQGAESSGVQEVPEGIGGPLRTNESLKQTISRLTELNQQLQEELAALKSGQVTERAARLAALNLLEDAEDARRRLQQMNIELDQRVRERTNELMEREERLRELASQLTRVEQQERQRLSRMLHDHVQQMLVAAKMRIDFARTDALEPEIREQLSAALAILNDSIEATRTLSVQLSPPLLHDQGLPAALEWLVSRMEGQHGLCVEARLDQSANPTIEEHRDILFQAAQEFLLNVAKHSGAKGALLSLERSVDQFWLEVTDFGTGFEVSQTPLRRGSFGLLHLRHRLESIGGFLTIQSSPEAGTSAAATLPAATVAGAEVANPREGMQLLISPRAEATPKQRKGKTRT
jgi:signal transduction histidine kinase